METKSNFFSDSLRAAEQYNAKREAFPKHISIQALPIQIKFFHDENTFSRNLSCMPGEVAILKSSASADYVLFIDLLMNKDLGSGKLKINHGLSSLEASDVLIVSERVLPTAKTLKVILKENGLVERTISNVLDFVGLGAKADLEIMDLSNWEKDRFAVVYALTSQHNLLVFDWPTFDFGRPWVEVMAEFIAESLPQTKQAALVLSAVINEKFSLPKTWESLKSVSICNLTTDEGSIGLEDLESDVVSSIQNLIRQNRIVEESSSRILTGAHSSTGLFSHASNVSQQSNQVPSDLLGHRRERNPSLLDMKSRYFKEELKNSTLEQKVSLQAFSSKCKSS